MIETVDRIKAHLIAELTEFAINEHGYQFRYVIRRGDKELFRGVVKREHARGADFAELKRVLLNGYAVQLALAEAKL